MASRIPSFEAFGSSEKPSSSVTHLWRSVKRTDSGSVSENFSVSASAMSSASFHISPIWILRSVTGRRVPAPPGRRDLHDHVALHHRLAAEPGMKREPFGGIEPVLLVGLHRREVLLPFLDDDVAGRAGAVAAAVVLEINVVSQSDVQDGARQAVLLERKLRRIDLHRDVQREKGHLVRHPGFFSSSASVTRFEARASLSVESIRTSAR